MAVATAAAVVVALGAAGLTACGSTGSVAGPPAVEPGAAVDGTIDGTVPPTSETTSTVAAPTTTATTAPPTTTTTAPVGTGVVTPVPSAPLSPGQKGPEVQQLQQRLWEMGYWLPAVDGNYSTGTRHAVTAFQKANGLDRSGAVDAATLAALATAARPTATAPVEGRSLEVDLGRQVLLVITSGHVDMVLDISSGKASTPTPKGSYKIQRQIDGMRISDLGELWRPKYFTGGYAIHGSPSVPTHAASHGCVRLTNDEINWVWSSGVAPVGTPLAVY